MCGDHASSDASDKVDPYANMPKSPYYDSHMPPRRSLPARIAACGWKYALVMAAVAAAFSYLGDRGSAKLAVEEGGQQGQQLRQNQKQPAGVPLGLNITRPAEAFWQGYRELLLAGVDDGVAASLAASGEGEGEGTRKRKGWFDDVRVDTTLIAEMWSKVEKPPASAAADGRSGDHHHLHHHHHQQQQAFHGSTVVSPGTYGRMEQDIHVRAAALRNASLALDSFLGNRTWLARDFMRGWVVGRPGLRRSSLGLSRRQLEELGPLLSGPPLPPAGSSGDGNGTDVVMLRLHDLATHDAATLATLARMAENVMREVVRQHALLLEPVDPDGTLGRLCRVTLPAARKAEARLIRWLAATSAAAAAPVSSSSSSSSSLAPAARRSAQWWHDQVAVRRLEHDVCELAGRRGEMQEALDWLRTRFRTLQGRHLERARVRVLVDDGGKGRGKGKGKGVRERTKDVPELLVWVQSAVELLSAASTVLMDVEEGVLLSLRRRDIVEGKRKVEHERELEEEKRKALGGSFFGSDNETVAAAPHEYDYERSWHYWKRRNCGATSCYDKSTPVTRLKYMFVKDKPLANEASDERGRLGWDVKVWKGVYEKACCDNGTLTEILKYGGRTSDFPDGPVFSHDEL